MSAVTELVSQQLPTVNSNGNGNGTAIFTQSRFAVCRFEKDVDVGQVGGNLPIPVPVPQITLG